MSKIKWSKPNAFVWSSVTAWALVSFVSLLNPLAVAAQFEGKLSPSNIVGSQEYGTVAVDANTGALIAVGAWDEDHPVSPLEAGAVYVHRFDGNQWTEEQRVVSPNPGNFDSFGSSTAISGDMLLVGELNDDAAGLNTGAVHVYEFDGTEWAFSTTLVSPTAGRDDSFGSVMALSGDLLVVGSPGDDEHLFSAGAAFVFRNDAGAWVQEAKLIASDTTNSAFFGTDVATDGDRIIVSALQATADGNVNAGAAYIFHNGASGWTEEARIVAPVPRSATNYGTTVDIEGDRALVGHNLGSPTPVGGNGAAHFYFHDAGGSGDWVYRQTLVPTGADSVGFMLFGSAVRLSGDAALVGAPNWAQGSANASGRVYGFEFSASDTLFVPSTGYISTDGVGGDEFGKSIAVAGDAVFVGSPGHQVLSGTASGAVYVYGMPAVGTAIDDDGSRKVEESGAALAGVYPNPASEYVSIAFTRVGKPIQVAVYDMLGRMHFDSLTRDDLSLQVSGWPSGQYVVVTRSGARVSRQFMTVIH